jgi:hypothetical protein
MKRKKKKSDFSNPYNIIKKWYYTHANSQMVFLQLTQVTKQNDTSHLWIHEWFFPIHIGDET